MALTNGKFVSSREVVQKWPDMLYKYLENNLHFDAPVPIRIGKYNRPEGAIAYARGKMVTRSQTNDMNVHGFNVLVPSIQIRQRPNYDKLLLTRPSVAVDRRRTLVMPIPQPMVQQPRQRRVTFGHPISTVRIRSPSLSPEPRDPVTHITTAVATKGEFKCK